MKSFIDATGKIIPRRETGLDRKYQRSVRKSIRRSRALGIIPYTANSR